MRSLIGLIKCKNNLSTLTGHARDKLELESAQMGCQTGRGGTWRLEKLEEVTHRILGKWWCSQVLFYTTIQCKQKVNRKTCDKHVLGPGDACMSQQNRSLLLWLKARHMKSCHYSIQYKCFVNKFQWVLKQNTKVYLIKCTWKHCLPFCPGLNVSNL